MMAAYRLAPSAERDVEEIGFYVALDNYDGALRLVNRFFETFALLADFPDMGRRRDEFPGVRSFAVKPYVIFYRQTQDAVEIVRVLHGSRDIPSLFE